MPAVVSRGHLMVFGMGLMALLGAWLGPLPALAATSFAAHMTMHMIVVAVAAPLLAFGAAGTPMDPVRHLPWLPGPIPASLVEFAVVWAWHAPVLHQAARHSQAGLLLEQGTFLASGLLLWCSAVGDRPRSRRHAAGVAGLLLTSMHMTLLGALLALAPRPLYRHATAHPTHALDDQHLGGAIMLLVGGAAYLAGGLGLSRGLLRSPGRT